MEIFKKANWNGILIILTFLIHYYIAWELFTTDDREIPLIPFFDFIPLQLNYVVRIFLLILITFSGIMSLIRPQQPKWLLLFILPCFLFILEDQLRLQPWLVQYLIMIFILTFTKEIGELQTKVYLQWTLLAVYFWAGFNKLNVAFAWEIFPWFTTPLGIGEDYFIGFDNLNHFPLPDENKIAFILPFLEIIIPFLLIIPKTRWTGIGIAVAMHLITLYAVGPFGQNWDHIVWPWNILLPIQCILLFGEKTEWKLRWESFKSSVKTKTAAILFLFLFIGPALAFFGFWDKGLSFYLYSGNSDEMQFHFEGYDEKLVHTEKAEYLYLDTTTMQTMMIPEYWYMEKIEVPIYQSERYMRKLGKNLCKCLSNPEEGGIIILKRKGFLSQQDSIKIPCKEL